MRRIAVSASRDYEVIVGRDLLRRAGALVSEKLKPCRAAIVTDSNVGELYAGTINTSLRKAGFEPKIFVFRAGEESKTLTTYSRILDFLAENRFTRADLVLALGGGVTGDMAGFAAATYMRGIPYVQVPTSFLAAADSSVGGKTAVDLPAGKNLAGAFWPPALVLCDCDAFGTLPEEAFADGVAESIKHGLIADAAFFERISQGDIRTDIEGAVCRNVEIKQSFVTGDERDRGKRNILNFGHTVGHAIEKCTGYAVTHGHAVAMGMVCVTRAAEKLGLCDEIISPKIIAALEKYGLPAACTLTAEELFAAAAGDKKRDGDSINLICLEGLGAARMLPMPLGELEGFIAAGLED